ncbi:hypothetical protein [uncultured Winogradskyella sp.]|uniref:hypothetical protein n=1 Tax=uncultured Winogradskyella sp. TaxID=395353 RepID=UPI002618921E|nr:hypothetical protein [uncultured Winogradskyella sp.]|tara:strand:+ start:5770 stop:6177 length:408 start_codon:yes stop_codon:yes gene_type:complete
MTKTTKEFLLKYGIPSLAIIVVVIQLFLVNTKELSRWKGGGYGMYTEIHYFYNQIYIPGMSVDSLVKDNSEMKFTLGHLMVMPNETNLKKAAELVLKTSKKDSIDVQIWKPIVNSENGIYTRVLAGEIHLNKSGL